MLHPGMSTAENEAGTSLMDLHADAPAAGGSLSGGEHSGLGSARPAPARPPALLLLHQAVAIVGAAAQLVITVSQWSQATSGMARAQTAALSALLLGLALAMIKWPACYWRHRWLMPVARILLYMVPSVRQTGVGASLMLERPAQPGWWGAAADFTRLLAGTRLLGVVVGGAAVLASPAVTLAMQTLLVLLTRNTPGYCSTQLLEDPLTQHRAALLASTLELGSFPVLVLVPIAEKTTMGSGMAEALLRGQVPADRVNGSLITFLSGAVGILLPTALAILCWQAPAAGGQGEGAEEEEEEDEHEADESDISAARLGTGAEDGAEAAQPWEASALQAEQPQPQRSGQPPAGPAAATRPGAGAWGHALRLAERAGTAADRALHFLFISTGGGLDSCALVCWWMLALGWWMCSRLSALPGAPQGRQHVQQY